MKFITRISFTGHLLETHTSVNPHGVKKKKKKLPLYLLFVPFGIHLEKEKRKFTFTCNPHP